MIIDEKNKIKIKKDKNFPYCNYFRITGEDHTIGNILHHKLVRMKEVIFCAYKKPHPLENFIVLKIVTKDNMTPIQAH